MFSANGSTEHEGRAGAAPALFWVLLAVTTVWRILLAWRLDPCDDEAYYFYWSLFPQLSYFDHPPLAAWAMTLTGFLFGDNIWTIRLWPLVSGVLFALLGRAAARRLFESSRAADLAGIFLLLMPGFAGNGLLMTPDTLFALAWAAALFCAWTALSSTRATPWWILSGIAAGLGMLSKYNMILYFLALALLWVMQPTRRRDLFVGTAISGGVALMFFVPVLIWNLDNDWISFRFQLGHGFSKEPINPLFTFAEFAGGMLLVATPGLAVMTFLSAARATVSTSPARRFAAAFFWPAVLLFGVASLRGKIAPNWPMIAFFPGLILLAADWHTYPAWVRRVSLTLLVLPALLAFVGLSYLALPSGTVLRVAGNPVRFARMEELAGGGQFAELVERKRRELGADFVCATRQQFFGKLAFFSKAMRGDLWLLGKGRIRFPWIDDRRWQGKDAVIVFKSEPKPEQLPTAFEHIEPAGEADIIARGVTLRRILFYRGMNYRPQSEEGTE